MKELRTSVRDSFLFSRGSGYFGVHPMIKTFPTETEFDSGVIVVPFGLVDNPVKGPKKPYFCTK